MEPISVALLVALVTGAGNDVGRQAWAGLSALVRRPFQRGQGPADTADAATVSSGEVELTRLEQAPTDPARAQAAQALSTALAARAAVDPEFSAELQGWHEQFRPARTGDGDVNSRIYGTPQFHGPVTIARDITQASPPDAGAQQG